MTTRPHTIQLAASILAITALISGAFPMTHTTAEPVPVLSRAAFGQDTVPLSIVANGRASQPLSFEINKGQAEADVKFVGRADNSMLLFKPNEVVLALRKPRQNTARIGALDRQRLNEGPSAPHFLSMRLEGADPAPRIKGDDIQEVRANYFIGNDPTKWVRGVETYSRVQYSGVYEGVDLLFYGNERRLEYDFAVAPGADPQEIRLRFEGADRMELSSDGALILGTPAGSVRHEAPVAYQDVNGSRLEVPAAFKRLDNGTIGFEIGSYDRSQPLVIDPILVYSTYLGGSADDFGRGIVADAAGNAFVIGDSFSSNFLRNASPTNSDVFIGKLAANGLILTYTFFGGSKNDSATGLTVDPAGNIYMSGSTESPDFPVFNSVGLGLKGTSDAFAVKLTPAADQFFYSSLVGGSGDETGVSIAADVAGNAYISGRTSSQDYPTFAAIQPLYGGGASDAFISKLMPDGKTFVYSSFLGGGAAENAGGRSGISIDSAGNAYVAGETQSTDFPTSNALRTTKDGPASSSDGFITKIDPSGANFVYATYIGGSDDDSAFAIAADQTGNAYVTGQTRSTSFTGSGTTKPISLRTDAFVAKLNPAGSAISYLAFIGGNNGDEVGNAIVVDSSGNAVIAGSAGDGAPTVNSIQSFSKGGTDAFVAKLGANGAVTFSSYLGGNGIDSALAVGLDGNGAIYLAGFTISTDFPTVTALVPDNAGAGDIFIAKIDPDTTPNRPVLIQAVISGKNLIVFGQRFAIGAVLRVNDVPKKTRNDPPDPTQVLFSKKAAKKIAPGQTVQLQVVNPNGQRSNLLFLRRPE